MAHQLVGQLNREYDNMKLGKLTIAKAIEAINTWKSIKVIKIDTEQAKILYKNREFKISVEAAYYRGGWQYTIATKRGKHLRTYCKRSKKKFNEFMWILVVI